MTMNEVIFKLMCSIKKDCYWLVALDNGGAPRIQHKTYSKARREACRLVHMTGERAQILFVAGDVIPKGGRYSPTGRPTATIVRNFLTKENVRKERRWI